MFLEEEIYGIEYRKLENRNRINIPFKFNAEPGDKITIVKAKNHAEVWTSKDIRKELEGIKNRINEAASVEVIKYYEEKFNELATSIIKDEIEFCYSKSGKNSPRLTLEKECMDILGFEEHEIVLQGMGNHINIWEKSVFDKIIGKKEETKKSL